METLIQTGKPKTFIEILLNIMSNFISNKTVTIKPKDPPWINKSIKTRLFKNFKNMATNLKTKRDSYRDDCKKSIDNSKESYLKQLGLNLADPKTSTKANWEIMNQVMKKCKSPRIPPILSDNNFSINWKDKANVFVIFFLFSVNL